MAIRTFQELKQDLRALIRSGNSDTRAEDVRTMFTNVLDTVWDKLTPVKKIFLNGELQTPDEDGNVALVVNVDTTDLATKQEVNDGLNQKVDKIAGKQLSTEDFTTAEKQKLAGLESPHYKGTYPNLEALQTAYPAGAPGDEAHVDVAGADVSVYIWDHTDSKWVQQQGATTEETAASIKSKYESNANTNAFTDEEKLKLSNAITSINDKKGSSVTLVANDIDYTTNNSTFFGSSVLKIRAALDKLASLAWVVTDRHDTISFSSYTRSQRVYYNEKITVQAVELSDIATITFIAKQRGSNPQPATTSIATLNAQIANFVHYTIEYRVTLAAGKNFGEAIVKSKLG